MFLQYKDVIAKVTQKILDEFEKFSPDISLQDGSDFSSYGLEATVIHVPGHTDGSIAILTSSGDLIAGDTLVNSDKPSPAPNASDFTILSDSVNRLKGMAIETVYPGHGNPFSFKDVTLC